MDNINKSKLARDLGISRQMVYKLMKKGMPVYSAEAARSWRRSRISRFMSKEGRIDGNPGIKRGYR